ncbi:hypothetical protein B0E41_22735 [Hydrogenophaga sp. A37]|nr:hypothetical protein B0E41_22735 [Hydrogenophaga sp. A37]
MNALKLGAISLLLLVAGCGGNDSSRTTVAQPRVDQRASTPVGDAAPGAPATDASVTERRLLDAAALNTAELQAAEGSGAPRGLSAKAAAVVLPVYRFFNTQTSAHFYTLSTTERDQVRNTLPVFSYEGPAFSAAPSAEAGLSPVHRFFNVQTGVHFYTISEDEKTLVQSALPQFHYEGVAYHASQVAGAGLFPLYRFYLANKGFHFYTASAAEAAQVRATLPQYRDEGVGYYVPGAASGTPAPQVTLTAASTSVAHGSATTLTWSATNATDCSAAGGWSGTQPVAGSGSTGVLTASSSFTLICSGPGGSGSQSVAVGVTGTGAVTGLNYPSNQSYSDDLRFKFTGANLLDPYPATYIWRVNLRHQNGYYTTFFWGPDGPFTAQAYYGAHPYPDGGGSNTTTHKWEVSIEGTDVVTDLNSHPTAVNYGAWHTQALVVRRVNTDEIEASFYWNLPDTTQVIRHTTQYADYANTFGSRPYAGKALSFGDAPWSIGNERLSGVLRGIQIYANVLTLPEILNEAAAPLSTGAGAANIWYLNLNPTPTDISDQSGQGHHPAWAGAARPSLWVGP